MGLGLAQDLGLSLIGRERNRVFYLAPMTPWSAAGNDFRTIKRRVTPSIFGAVRYTDEPVGVVKVVEPLIHIVQPNGSVRTSFSRRILPPEHSHVVPNHLVAHSRLEQFIDCLPGVFLGCYLWFTRDVRTMLKDPQHGTMHRVLSVYTVIAVRFRRILCFRAR
jgi:hypothetical protein